MSQQMKVTLVGAKSTDWKSEDGRHYDHVTLFGIIPIACPYCGTYWHLGQIQDHKNKCDQKG